MTDSRWVKRWWGKSRPPVRTHLLLETLDGRVLPSVLTTPGTLGNVPVAVATADFNGDGKLDLVVVNHEAEGTPGSLGIFLGNGDGTFQPADTIPVSPKPFAVAVGDFNGDGIPDLAVTDAGDQTRNTVSVLLGVGDGTFQTPQTYTVGRDPRAVAVGDVNGDGIPDIVTASRFDGLVSVLLGNGDGTFRNAINTLVSGGPDALALADLNGDGRLDVLTNIQSFGQVPGQVQVSLGNGDGTFRSVRNLEIGAGERNLTPRAIAVGDFNGDGKPDIATANTSDVRGTISVLLGNGDGSFGTFFRYGDGGSNSQPLTLLAGDFNGDGVTDLLTTNLGTRGTPNTVNVLAGIGDGAFGPPIQSGPGAGADAVAVGDFNGDGIPDVATVDTNGAALSVLLGVGDGSFLSPMGTPSGSHQDRGTVPDARVHTVPASPPARDVDPQGIQGQGNVSTPRTILARVPGVLPRKAAPGDLLSEVAVVDEKARGL